MIILCGNFLIIGVMFQNLLVIKYPSKMLVTGKILISWLKTLISSKFISSNNLIDSVVDFNLISLTFIIITILVLICAPKITYGINILFLWRTFAGSVAEEQNHFYLLLLNIFSAFQINNNYADSQAYKNHKFLSCLKVCLCCFFEDLDRTCSNVLFVVSNVYNAINYVVGKKKKLLLI